MTDTLLTSSAFYQLAAAFGAGFLSSLTPCVYPLIPITLAVFGVHQQVSRMRAFGRSLTYVAGMALTYCTLGVLSAQSGAVFGQMLGHPAVIVALCLVLFLLFLLSLDLVQFAFLADMQSFGNKAAASRTGLPGAFIMGMVSGLVAAPCVGPVLVIILGVAAQSQTLWWGALLLLSYALGLGLIFLVLGTCSSLINKLPRAGNWLHGVKILIAALLLVTIFYNLQIGWPLTSSSIRQVLSTKVNLGLSLLALLVFIAALLKSSPSRKLCASFLVACSLAQVFLPWPLKSYETEAPATAAWLSSYQEALAAAKREEKIIIMDFSAEWCVVCKQLERITFVDASVSTELSKFIRVRLDFDQEAAQEIAKRYGVVGLPAILFIDANGEELPNSRISGFLSPAEFLEHLTHKVAPPGPRLRPDQ